MAKNTNNSKPPTLTAEDFIKQGQVEDTFKIAEILIDDEHELINKAVGSWLREAGQESFR